MIFIFYKNEKYLIWYFLYVFCTRILLPYLFYRDRFWFEITKDHHLHDYEIEKKNEYEKECPLGIESVIVFFWFFLLSLMLVYIHIQTYTLSHTHTHKYSKVPNRVWVYHNLIIVCICSDKSWNAFITCFCIFSSILFLFFCITIFI